MSVKKFKTIFDGLQLAYGVFKIEKTAANGKSTGRAAVIREPRTNETWKNHLAGKGTGIGIIPIKRAESVCLGVY